MGIGDHIFLYLLGFFSQCSGKAESPELIVSGGLSDLITAAAYFMLAGTILWMISQARLLRSPLVYMFAAFITLCGIGHIGHIVRYPEWFELLIDFATWTVSLTTAFVLFQRRHFILRIIFHFQNVTALLGPMRAHEKRKERDDPIVH